MGWMHHTRILGGGERRDLWHWRPLPMTGTRRARGRRQSRPQIGPRARQSRQAVSARHKQQVRDVRSRSAATVLALSAAPLSPRDDRLKLALGAARKQLVETSDRDKHEASNLDRRDFPAPSGLVCAVSADAELFGSLGHSKRHSLGTLVASHYDRQFCETKSRHKIDEDYPLSTFLT